MTDKPNKLILPDASLGLNIPYSEEFIRRAQAIKKDMHDFYTKIGEEATPAVDGSGRKIVERRGDGQLYIIEGYMRKKLDEYFPGWSLVEAAPLHFMGAEWVVAQIYLEIIDEHLLTFGIVPPIRRFYGVDGVRIQYKGGVTAERRPENIVDIGDNCKQAVSAALKYATNRLTNIGDDIYGKRIDLEGAGSIDTVMTGTVVSDVTARTVFNEYCISKHIKPSVMHKVLGIKSSDEITDYKEAYLKIKEHVIRSYLK